MAALCVLSFAFLWFGIFWVIGITISIWSMGGEYDIGGSVFLFFLLGIEAGFLVALVYGRWQMMYRMTILVDVPILFAVVGSIPTMMLCSGWLIKRYPRIGQSLLVSSSAKERRLILVH
jgi:hypothetical protein